MKHLIVLHAASAVGGIYAVDANRHITVGEHRHPVLDCIEMDLNNPYYIFAKRRLKDSEQYQSLYLPHGSVVMILRYEESDPPTIGFGAA